MDQDFGYDYAHPNAWIPYWINPNKSRCTGSRFFTPYEALSFARMKWEEAHLIAELLTPKGRNKHEKEPSTAVPGS